MTSKLKVFSLVLAVLVVALLGVRASHWHLGHSPVAASVPAQPQAPPQVAGADLKPLMQQKVHEEYTFLSFTIWHDGQLTSEKMEAIAASSNRILDASHGLAAFENAYRQQGWTAQDVKFFDDERLQLSRVAEELKLAAKQRDKAKVERSFEHMDGTCQSCHKRFRPDLSWT